MDSSFTIQVWKAFFYYYYFFRLIFNLLYQVLDAFLSPGSELWMFNEVPEKERERKLIDGGLDVSRLMNIELVNREGNAVIRRHLESLPLESFDSVSITLLEYCYWHLVII